MRKKKLVAMLLAATTLVSTALPVTANAASYNWRKGGFSGGTSWTTTQVYNAYNSYPAVTFYSYYENGKKSNGNTMQVQLINANTGAVLESAYNVRSGWTYNFKGHATRYYIKIRRKANNSNAANSAYWAMRSRTNHGNFR